MISSQGHNSQGGPNVLEARMDNARNMATLLKAVHFKETALVSATEQGLKVSVDDSKAFLANAYIQADLFNHYAIKQDVLFRIPLNILLECLNIFGGTSTTSTSNTTAFELCYAGEGHPLILILEEEGVMTNCSIKTLEPDTALNFEFDNDAVVNKLIIKSECLKEIFSELDQSSEVIQMEISSNKPHFRISTFGNTGTYHWDIPKDSEMMEQFSYIREQNTRYRMSLIRPCIKALMVSSRTSLRTSPSGALSLQFMIRLDEDHTSFTEYYVAPNIDEEDEDESEN